MMLRVLFPALIPAMLEKSERAQEVTSYCVGYHTQHGQTGKGAIYNTKQVYSTNHLKNMATNAYLVT